MAARKDYKGIFATDNTDNNWTNLYFTRPQQDRGPVKKRHRFAN
jgi:hypothetical protein